MKSSRKNFNLYPLVWLAASLAFGIIFSKWLDPSPNASLIASAVMMAATVASIKKSYSVAFLSVAFIAAGALLGSVESHSVREDRIRSLYDTGAISSGEPVEVEGVLAGLPELSVDGFFLRLRATRLTHNGADQTVSGDIRVFATSPGGQFDSDYAAMTLQYGTRVRVACNLEREERFLNPGVVSHKITLDHLDIDATGTIKSPLLVEVVGQERVFLPLAWVFEQRQKLISEFRMKFSGPTTGVLTASLLGDGYFLDKRTADVFREGGTFHALVISGLHVTFIGAMILLVLQLFTKNRFFQFVIASLFLWAFCIAVGADVPVIRATVMFTILAFSQVVNRRGTLLNSLGFCALLMLVWRPDDLFTASFQLTFASVSAIVVIAFPLVEKLRTVGKWTPTKGQPFPAKVPESLRRICEALYWRDEVWVIEAKQQIWSARLFKSTRPRWLSSDLIRSLTSYVFEGILVSLIVQLVLLPFVIVYFHRISLVSVLMNLWAGFFMAVETFTAIISVFLDKISPTMATPFMHLTEGLNWLLLSFPGWFVDRGWASFRLPSYSGPMRIVYVLYMILIAVVAFMVFRWRPFDHKIRNNDPVRLMLPTAALFVALLMIVIFHPFSAPRADGKLNVDFLDVGQGDSALITFPDGETMLVDGGGRRSFRSGDDETEEPAFEPDTQRIGEAVVSAFLWEKGYSKIDYILATHADADHIQGLSDVAENFSVRQAFFGRTPAADPDFAELAGILRKRNIPSTTISQGDEFDIAGVRVEILYPLADDSPNAVSDNDHSVVLHLVFGERSILMTGDIERKAENDLLAMRELLASDVIKVPHHGSRTSSTQGFIDAVHPGLAVISVGRHSVFGHPHPEVVERWRTSGSKTITTGEFGTVSVSTDGQNIELKTFLPE